MSLFTTYLEQSNNNLHNKFMNENKGKKIFQQIPLYEGDTQECYTDEYVEWLEAYCKFLEGTN